MLFFFNKCDAYNIFRMVAFRVEEKKSEKSGITLVIMCNLHYSWSRIRIEQAV